MKALAHFGPLVTVVVALLACLNSHAEAQPEQTFQCVLDQESPAAIQPGGRYIPARDTFHVLIVFAEFPDDLFDTTNANWPKYPSAGVYPGPLYLNTFIDSIVSQSSQNGNMSHYFRDMSMGAFKLTGKAYHVVTPQTRQWYRNNGNWGHGRVNKDVLLKLDSTISFAPFDKWIRGTNYNHTKGQDGIVDMIFMLYRSAIEDVVIPDFNFAIGQADLGLVGDIWVDNNARRIQTSSLQSGTTSVVAHSSDGRTLNLPPYRVQIHELAHFFFGGNSWHNGGGFWAVLNDWASRKNAQRQSCINSMERELLGWIAPDSLYQTTYNVTLTDYVTTGDAVKIKLPGGNPNEYFRLEYHLRTSQFDTPEEYDPNAKGLYIIHQVGLGSPEDAFARLLPADGRWTWVSDEVVYPSYYPTGLAVYKRSGIDRVNGYDDSRLVPFTWVGPPPSPNVPNPSWIHFHRDRQTNQLIEQTIFRGDGRDAWSLAKNNAFTPWSSPNSQNQAKQKTWVGIEIANELPESNTIVLNVYFDSAGCVTLPPSKPHLGWDPRYLGRPYEYGWIYLAWGADFWDGHPIEPDVDWSELQRKVGTFPWVTVYSGPNRTWSDHSITYDPNGSTPVYFRARVRDTQNKWSLWSDLFDTKMMDIAVIEKAFQGDIPKEAPSTFALSQNYPNPFNPSTQINFDLPEAANVSLVIYDVLGRKVAELVNGQVEAGYRSVTWNAANAASGVYFARFTAANPTGDVKLTKVTKLLLTK